MRPNSSNVNVLSNFLLILRGNKKPTVALTAPDLDTLEKQERLSASQAQIRSHAESSSYLRLSAEFGTLAGSERNACSLVEGLRDGITVTLDCADCSSANTSFMPPTGRMGYSNVVIALTLVRQQLAAQGIIQPLPDQLQAALVGGKIVSPLSNGTVRLPGVLQLKKDGKGWGKIANLLGVKLADALGGARIPVLVPVATELVSLRATKKMRKMVARVDIDANAFKQMG